MFVYLFTKRMLRIYECVYICVNWLQTPTLPNVSVQGYPPHPILASMMQLG